MLNELAVQLKRFSVQIGSGGSGVIWSSDGLIVTNAHVLRNRETPVLLHDGRRLTGTLLARDQQRDLAALRIPALDLAAPAIGNSDRLRVGQLVVAMGNPLGITGAITSGIIHSGGGRKVRGQSWVEADVSLAPGNSGGMLADAEGAIIGINTMIFGGLALAVPVNDVSAFLSAHFSVSMRAKAA